MAGFLNIFRPDEYADSVADIDCSALKAAGFEVILLDMDNTLLPWKSTDIPDDVRKWVHGAKQAGFRLAILSNTHSPRRLNKIASELGVPSIAHALKPWAAQFRKAARLAGCEFCRAVVVGDQLLTDILGGNLAGMKTILVKPMHPHEFIGTKVSRLVERLILSMLPKAPRLGTKSEGMQSQTEDAK